MSSTKYTVVNLDTRVAVASFNWSASGGDTLVPGDRVTFTMQAANDAFGADTGGSASATVGGWRSIALAGQAGGVYSDTCTFTLRMPEVTNVSVTVSFIDRAGNAALIATSPRHFRGSSTAWCIRTAS